MVPEIRNASIPSIVRLMRRIDFTKIDYFVTTHSENLLFIRPQ